MASGLYAMRLQGGNFIEQRRCQVLPERHGPSHGRPPPRCQTAPDPQFVACLQQAAAVWQRVAQRELSLQVQGINSMDGVLLLSA